jgi:hypothetical protein
MLFSALSGKSMFLVASFFPASEEYIIFPIDIFWSAFMKGTHVREDASEVIPVYFETLCHWSRMWTSWTMEDAIVQISYHNKFCSGQKIKSWDLFNQVSPSKKAQWVADCRESKSLILPRSAATTKDDRDALKDMVRNFTFAKAPDFPALPDKKRKRESDDDLSE